MKMSFKDQYLAQYLLYINVYFPAQHSSVHLYADDTTLYAKGLYRLRSAFNDLQTSLCNLKLVWTRTRQKHDERTPFIQKFIVQSVWYIKDEWSTQKVYVILKGYEMGKCFPHACLGFLWVLQLPPVAQRCWFLTCGRCECECELFFCCYVSALQ